MRHNRISREVGNRRYGVVTSYRVVIDSSEWDFQDSEERNDNRTEGHLNDTFRGPDGLEGICGAKKAFGA
jgi:hypothetical protein